MRYDGGHKLDARLVATLEPRVELVPICPEVEAGLGVPRAAIELVTSATPGRPGPDEIVAVTASGLDVTAMLRSAAERLVRQAVDERLSGFVLKSRSPSCGIDTVPIRAAGSARVGSGVFVTALRDLLPKLPIEDEVRLADPVVLHAFFERVFEYHAGH